MTLSELHQEIVGLREQTSENAEKLATIDGKLEGTLPHLATEGAITEIVNDSLDRHVDQLHKVGKTPPLDKKVMLALVGSITGLVTLLSVVIQKVLTLIPSL